MARVVIGMLRKFRIKGLCTAPVTPFKQNGDINLPYMKTYVQHLVDFGVPNAFVNGTTGEGNNMTTDERKEVAEAWINEAKGKLSAVIVQVGANNLRESQILAKHAESAGADAIACVGTAFYKPQSMDDYIDYMAGVAAAAPKTPFMLYDIDFFTGITLDVSTFFEKAKPRIPNLCGVKHTSPNFVSINNTLEDHPDIQILLGSDELYIEGLAIGVEGTIMNSYNGNVLNRLREAYDKGDLKAAREEQKRMLAVGKIRRKYGLSIAGGSKVILNLIGLEVGQPRCPLSPISDSLMSSIKKDLEGIGFFEWALKK